MIGKDAGIQVELVRSHVFIYSLSNHDVVYIYDDWLRMMHSSSQHTTPQEQIQAGPRLGSIQHGMIIRWPCYKPTVLTKGSLELTFLFKTTEFRSFEHINLNVSLQVNDFDVVAIIVWIKPLFYIKLMIIG